MVFGMFAEFKRYNTLHYPGSLNDQPDWLICAFNVISEAINYSQELDDRKDKRKQAAQERKNKKKPRSPRR